MSKKNSDLMHPHDFYINGNWVSPSSESKFDVVNPGTGELYLTVAEAQAADVDHAVAAARAAFDNGPWPRMSPAERGACLRRIAQAMAKRGDAFARLWSAQTGLVHTLSKAITPAAAQTFE